MSEKYVIFSYRRSYDDEPRMVNIERTRPNLTDGGGSGVLSNKSSLYIGQRDERPYTSGEVPSISLHVQNSLRK